MKKYEQSYSGYIYEEPKTSWSSEEYVKSKLTKVNLSNVEIEAGGIPVISDGKTAYIDTSDSHTAIEAISGMKKSICFFMPLIYILGKANENMVITDPKGELYSRTSGYLYKQGYKIKCIDLRDFDKDGFNILAYPAKVYRHENKDKGLMLLSDVVNVLMEKERSGKCDPFWPDTAASWATGTGGLMLESFPEKAINLLNWTLFNTETGVEIIREILNGRSYEDNAITANLKSVLAEPDKTLMSTLSTASSVFTPFIQNNKLASMLSNSTFELDELTKKKTALFIITDDTSTTCDSIEGIIISQIMSYLVGEAYIKTDGKLKNRENFVLDEFAQIPIPESTMEKALAAHRSRNIRYYLCVQTIDGLKSRYEHYESLLSNCGNTMFLGSTEKEMLDRVSNQCGTTNYTIDGREKSLISTAELMNLKKEWHRKEAIYLNLSDSIRYFTCLPSIEAYDLGNNKPQYIHYDHPEIATYTPKMLYNDIAHENIPIPFSKSKKKKAQYSSEKNTPESDVSKELEEMFNKLLGPPYDN